MFVDAPTAVDNEPAQYVYSVKVRQSASGCESEVYFIDTITVNPNPSLELVTDPIVCAEGDSNVVLYANVDPMPATPVTYKWMEDNAVVATTTSPNLTEIILTASPLNWSTNTAVLHTLTLPSM